MKKAPIKEKNESNSSLFANFLTQSGVFCNFLTRAMSYAKVSYKVINEKYSHCKIDGKSLQ